MIRKSRRPDMPAIHGDNPEYFLIAGWNLTNPRHHTDFANSHTGRMRNAGNRGNNAAPTAQPMG
jgi:hypothetical protein